ncbi:hypothetical protein QO058_20420 [Bosea vestrisii]|uniref:hypothetical protein n=1 Tax=Bosea vestrisii TaxID=151416 RepID=UPI0024DF74D4|nr:hypothetical protein [Bosea vestrisii]WID95147.1 hypothetical protein QO058_20420 [Bosea vestrisii]
MAYLDGQGLASLRDAISGGGKFQRGFVGQDDFATFVNESFSLNFNNISKGESFSEKVYNFIDELNVKGDIDEFLYLLSEYWDRKDLLQLIRNLLDEIEGTECARSYFVSYAGLEKESKTNLTRAGAFSSLDGWACLPSGDRKIIKLTETIKGEIDRSELFVALVGRYYVRSDKLQGEIFDYALDNWRASLNPADGHRSNRRFAVLFLDQAGRNWWEDRYAASVRQSDSLLIEDIGADLAMSAPSIRDWLAGASGIGPKPDESQLKPEGGRPN